MRSALLQSIVKISFSTRIKEGTGNGELFLSSSITISNLVAEKVPREARFWFEDHCAGKVNSSLAGERQRARHAFCTHLVNIRLLINFDLGRCPLPKGESAGVA